MKAIISTLAFGLFFLSASASAKIVGNYQLHISAQPAGREPAFVFVAEDGWQCRTLSTVSYRKGAARQAHVTETTSLLESPQVASGFERDLQQRADSAHVLVRETCRRDNVEAFLSWICPVGGELPERLWQARVVPCRPAAYSIPEEDPQSQLLKSLRNRTFKVTITLRDKRERSL